MDRVDRVANELRNALAAYVALDATDQARVVVELFGLRQSKHAAPLLAEVARIAQSEPTT